MANAPRKAKVPVADGTLKDAILVNPTTSKETWSEYELEDGAIVKMRQLATEFWRLENEYDQEGNPVYVIKAAAIVNIIAPESLKKKAK